MSKPFLEVFTMFALAGNYIIACLPWVTILKVYDSWLEDFRPPD